MNQPQIELYLIRHAESVLNTTPQYINGRSNETPLTEQGVDQAYALGRFLLAHNVLPSSVFASPSERTKQTGRYCLDAMQIDDDLVVCSALQELDQGDWVGKLRTETYSEAVMGDIRKLGKHFKAPGGESMHEVGERMSSWGDKTFETASAMRALVFTHGVAIRCWAGRILDWDQQQIYRTITENTSITKLVKYHSKWDVAYVGLDPVTGQSAWPGGPVPTV